MRLPPLDDTEIRKKEEAKYSVKLPEIDLLNIDEDKEKFKEHFKEFIDKNKEIPNDEDYQNKYRAMEKIYKNLMGINEKENNENLLEIYEEEIKKLGLYDLETLNKAIDTGEFDISKYDIFTMSKLLKKLEKTKPPKSLKSYPIKTIEDFYIHITSGKIDISKYEESEIDEFVDSLVKQN